MDPELKAKAYTLVAIIVLMTILGACVIFGLTRAWARHNRRLRNQRKPQRQRRAEAPAVDPWQASARRLFGEKDHVDPLHDPTDPSLDLPPGLATKAPPKPPQTDDDPVYPDESIDEHDFDDDPWHDDQSWRGDIHPDVSEEDEDEED